MTSARDWRGLLFVAPFLLLYSVILIFPLLRGMWISLNQVDLFGAGRFVGVGNYVRLFHDPVFGTSLVNTLEVTLMIVPPLTIIALALAMALNRASRSAALFRGIFFSSAVLSVTIVTWYGGSCSRLTRACSATSRTRSARRRCRSSATSISCCPH